MFNAKKIMAKKLVKELPTQAKRFSEDLKLIKVGEKGYELGAEISQYIDDEL